MTFDIVIKNEKLKTYHLLSWLILIIHLAYFSYLFYNGQKIGGGGILLIAAALTYRSILYKTKKKELYPDGLFFVLLLGIWAVSGNYLMAAIILIVGIFYSFADTVMIITFSEDCIKKKYFPFSQYTWGQLDNVILKDNILTIDFKSNMFIQSEIEPGSSIDEQQFNEFAQSMLSKPSNI